MLKCPICNGCCKALLFGDGKYYYCPLCLKVYKLDLNGNTIDVSNEIAEDNRTYIDVFIEIFGKVV